MIVAYWIINLSNLNWDTRQVQERRIEIKGKRDKIKDKYNTRKGIQE